MSHGLGSQASDGQPARAVPPPTSTLATRTASGEEVFSLAEEELNVGKHLIPGGITRIHRFVTNTPVEAQITLHEEHVQVVRRAISDPESVRDIDWAEKTIEVTDTVEEPVTTKSVHIAEEVVIRKQGIDRVETVRDQIRRQQIEVERLPPSEPPLRSERD